MKHFTRHLFSMTAAAAIGFSSVLNCGSLSALAAYEHGTTKAGKLVPVIIKLSGEAVLAGEEAAELGTDYLDTSEAEEKATALSRISSEAEDSLRNLYPALEVGYHYDVLMNGFSCKLPENLIAQARNCRWVESISKIETINVIKPNLYSAAEAGEADYFRETTGYFGEGEVIAVLDTEFDITHDMFAPIDDKHNKLTKDDIIAAANDLNVQIDPEKAYISSKLPYVIDYADDTPYDCSDPLNYHGTHVAGIAAGDKISDSKGDELAGIAPDAQIIMMKVFGEMPLNELGTNVYTIDSDIMIAALEDAAKLKADVINLSFGGIEPNLDNIPCKDTISSLNNAGIMVVTAAGNDSNNFIEQGVYLDMDTSFPDTNTIGSPSVLKEAFTVASANNAFSHDPCFKIEGLDDEIPFNSSTSGNISDLLGDGVYEYVYCGIGMPEDFEGKDVAGKIALIDRGDLMFFEKGMNAEMAGAIAMIVCDNIEEDELISMQMNGFPFPAAFISLNNGAKMKEAESGKIRLDSTLSIVSPLDGGISEFSSFGPASDLTLKPDIAGIGGEVSSAAYDNKIKQERGTSMSSPYVAGCAAVLDQYLKKNGSELAGAEKTAFLKNLMMNSAVLFSNDDVYESPRRQGAGLVNMKNVINDRVILTGETGLAKVELKDKLTSQLSFDIDINNFTDEDVEFKEAKLVLTAEDGAALEGDESGKMYISGASNIGVTADLSGLLKANANETRKVTVNAQLSEEDLDSRGTTFPNGFFVEGYLVLSGAENCCDISIPVLGFYGDWAKVPIFHNGTMYLEPYKYSTYTGEGIFDAMHSFAGIAEAVYQFTERLTDEEKENMFMNPFFFSEHGDDEYNAALDKCSSENIYLSPNGDGMAEKVSVEYSLLRSAHVSGLKIYDSDNNLVINSDEDSVFPAHMVSGYFAEEDISKLPEGKYKGAIEGYIFYDGAKDDPQSFEFPIVIDKTAPTLEIKPKEENGRKLLEITSADDHLDGIYILGKGNGGIAGEYNSDSQPLTEMNTVRAALNAYYMPIDGAPENTIRTDSFVLNFIMGTADEIEQNIYNSYDFSDILPAYRYQDDNGNISVTYDVTDLDEYFISAVDRAFNATEIMSEGSDISHLKTGVWWAKNGGENDAYYNFKTLKSGSIRYQNGAPEKSFTFEQNDNNITMVLNDGTSSETRTGKISFTDKKNAVITWDGGTEEKLFYADSAGFGSFDYITTPEIKALVTDYHNANSDSKADKAEVTYDENGMAVIRLMDKKGSVIAEYTNFNRFENTAVAPDGKPVKFEYIRYGVYRVTQQGNYTNRKHYYVIFAEDGKATVYSAENGIEWEGTAEYGNNVISLNKGKDDEKSIDVTYNNITSFSVKPDDENEYKLTYEPDYNTDNFMLYTTAQLKEMAADYCERTMGSRPDIHFAFFDPNNRYKMYVDDFQSITADPLGGSAIDQFGNKVDLTVLPEIKDLFTAGLWSTRNENGQKYYSSDGKGNFTVINAEDGSKETMKYNWIGTKAVELISVENTERFTADALSDTVIVLTTADYQTETLVYMGEKTIDQTSFYSNQKLADMAAADLIKKTGKKASVSEIVSSDDGTVSIRFDNGSVYAIDRFTGKGIDDNGCEVDLPQTGINNTSTAAASVSAGILIVLGTAAVFVSRRSRRKEDL